MGLKKEEMRNGCFAKAHMDEPLFVLRATDKTAPGLVRKWASDFMKYHEKQGTSGHALADCIHKHQEALDIADAMEQWPDRKFPD